VATDIYMPLLGLTMSEGTVSRWLKAEGDPIKKGEPVLEIETDKSTVEIEAPTDGVIGPILVAEGAVVPVGTVLSYVLAPGESPPDDQQSAASSQKSEVSSQKSVVSSQTEKEDVSSRDIASSQPTQQPAYNELRTTGYALRIFASPLARRVAHEQSIDLRHVEASGPGGRIVVADVHWYLDQQRSVASSQMPVASSQMPVVSSQRSEVRDQTDYGLRTTHYALRTTQYPSPNAEPMTPIRRLIAERMVASQQATAHVTLMLEAEATQLAGWRESLKLEGHPVSYNDLLVCIVARALSEQPAMMSQVTPDGQIYTPDKINIGLAVDTPRGLLVPVLADVGGQGPLRIAAQSQALIERARAGKSQPDELSGGVFTLSNLGMHDIEAFTPVINLPECAILGVGKIEQRAVVRQGQVCARLMVALSLTFDHRLVDGAPAARFLQRIKQLIERPLALLD
jgi:pyruvate dehydrogenase E2 component (dihydrolipoamide acetyltransferase)